MSVKCASVSRTLLCRLQDKVDGNYLLRKNPETPRGISTVAGVVGYVIRPDSDTTSVASSYTAEAWTANKSYMFKSFYDLCKAYKWSILFI